MGKRQTRRPVPAAPAAPARVDVDPCDCREYCDVCDTRCMGGHALNPWLHLCVEGHWWGELR